VGRFCTLLTEKLTEITKVEDMQTESQEQKIQEKPFWLMPKLF
jgi:hypothetical protein